MKPFVQQVYYITFSGHLLVTGEGFDTLYINSESLVISKDLVDGLHQLLLLSSHICFLFTENQDDETILILTHRNAAVAHCLENKPTKTTINIQTEVNRTTLQQQRSAKPSAMTLNLQKGFSWVNSTGGLLLL